MATSAAASLGASGTVPTEDTSRSIQSPLTARVRQQSSDRNNQDDGEGGDEEEEDDDDDEGAGMLSMNYGDEGDPDKLDKPLRRKVLIMSVLFLFIIELSGFIMDPPLQEIMQDLICHDQYTDHKIGSWHTDPRCDEPGVEGQLAMDRSSMVFAKTFFPLLVQIPYGTMADKVGRRPILFLALLGSLMSTAWTFIVLSAPGTFSVKHLPIGFVFTLVGGGDSVTGAMAWTIIQDVLPADERTGFFYKLHAMMLIMSAALKPVAGWLMSIDPWLPMWLSFVALGFSTVAALFVPETLHLSRTAPKLHVETIARGGQRSKTATIAFQVIQVTRAEALRIWHFVFSSKKVMLLMAAYGLSQPVFFAFEMQMLQYMTVRFSWDWTTATYYSVSSKATAVIVLLGVLPFASRAIGARFGGDSVARDHMLALISISFIIAGNVLTAFAAVPWFLIIALLIYGVGAGYFAQLRSLLSETVDSSSLATMTSVLAVVETLFGLVSIPILGWLLSVGIGWGSFWVGLPFVLTSISGIGSATALRIFKKG